jgi:protein ImuB
MSMHWAALRLNDTCSPPPASEAAGVAVWALQFTPRVAHLDEAVLMELAASERLFGGAGALQSRIAREAAELGVLSVAWAPTSLAALALVRAGVADGRGASLEQILDRLPLEVLSAVAAHAPTLARLGCKTLGDVRALPRGGISRRFDKALLTALDQAYGLRPTVHDWVTLPDTFARRLELPGRVDTASSLMAGAHRLLLQLCGWLAARHAGITCFVFGWCHDSMRSRSAGDGGELAIRTAEPTRDIRHLGRLLSEHLAKVELLAPAGDISLRADEVFPLEETSASLLPDSVHQGEVLVHALERVSARLGPGRVQRPVLTEDHRLEWMQRWQATSGPAPRPGARSLGLPQPTWVLDQPLKLAVRDNRPLYQGPLQLLLGPERVEGGWWHRVDAAGGEATLNVQRDYWVALSAHAGVLWVFQERLSDDDPGWFLHGHFA